MTYVLDSCVGVKWAVVETDTPRARALRAAYVSAVHELIAPDIFPAEIATPSLEANGSDELLTPKP